jgi:thiamine biosynthesis lipoprotein
MPLQELLPVGPDTEQWSVWGTTARIVVTDASLVGPARVLVESELAAIGAACSRFRDDSELSELQRYPGRPTPVSPLLGELLTVALEAAARTGGDVDPTVGGAMVLLGYDRDFAYLTTGARPGITGAIAVPGWQRLGLRTTDEGTVVTLPAGMRLDLGATAKAFSADRCARRVAERFGCGVLVALGGDIATAGETAEGGWRVLVQDRPGDPRTTVTLPARTALATSSTVSRTWRQGGDLRHHIVDPISGRPAAPHWRTVSVVAADCVSANTLATASIVRGAPALRWLRELGASARFVRPDLSVFTIGAWPDEPEAGEDD